uniref:tRNA-splicing endonuclease subunit Sen15 domain-containing protein n=1 Tax=Anthracocystis walkeri TaxID=1134040 RepID=H2CZ50_9BASI|nr:hypothetical protein [Anthracocystis walkeri]
MTSTPTSYAEPSLPEASSHQLSKRQQYDALLDAEVGVSSSSSSLGSPAAHPSFPAVAPLCRRYPTQASAIFQTYLDLKNGAAAWDVVEPLALSSNPQSVSDEATATYLSNLTDAEADELIQQRLKAVNTGTAKLGLVSGNDTQDGDEEEELLKAGLAAIKGRRKDAKSYEVVIPLTITQHLRPLQLKAIFALIEAHAATCPEGEEVDTSHLLLAIIAPDSTLVYYIVSQGLVKPIN